jgi:TonB family protein
MLILLYLAYKWALSTENYHRMKRALIWGIYIVTLMATPSISKPSFFANIFHSATASDTSPLNIAVEDIIVGKPIEQLPAVPLIITILTAIYLVGVVAVLGMTLVNSIKLSTIIRRGKRLQINGYNVVITDNQSLAPFSFCRTIVIPQQDYATAGEMILTHEQAHVNLHHWIDLLFAQLICTLQWYNPAAWLMQEELKTVHEYQADSQVILSGCDIRQYQLLLIKKAVGARFPSLANSLNHSKLKKRITMMYNQKKSRRGAFRSLALLPAFAVAFWVAQLPAVASSISAIASAELFSSQPTDKVSEFPSKSQAPQPTSSPAKADANQPEKAANSADVMPEYPGGFTALMQYLIENIQYPKTSEMKVGQVVVKFVIDKDGSVKDPEVVKSLSPEYDAEAVRVISSLPNFTPGTSNGEPVAVTFNLPIQFSTAPDTPANSAK